MCPNCQKAKSSQLPFKTSHSKSLHPLDLIYSDVWGPAHAISTTGACYYISFFDDCTKFLWLFPIKLKSDVESIFMQFQAYVERQFNTQIKIMQSDGGGEYRHLSQHFKTIGIHHRVACSHTH